MMVLVFALVFGVCLVLASGVCIMIAQNMFTSNAGDAIKGKITSCTCEYSDADDLYHCKCDLVYDDGTEEIVEETSKKEDGEDLIGTEYEKEGGTQTVPQWLYIVAVATFLSGVFISGFAMVAMHGRMGSPSSPGMGAYYKI